MKFFWYHFGSEGIECELPSVRPARAEAAIGSYLETPIASSSPLALCQRRHVRADTFENVAPARTESGDRSGANCGPAGMKPTETFLVLRLARKAISNRVIDK